MMALWNLLWRATVLAVPVVLVVVAARGVLCALHAPRRAVRLLWLAVLLRLLCPVSVSLPVSLFSPAPVQQALETATGVSAASGTLVLTGAAMHPVQRAAVWVWLAGAAALLSCGLWQYLRLWRRVRFAYRDADGCYTGDGVDTPFLLGFLRPRIYLPASLTGEARAMVLAHERAHLRALDHLTRPLFYLALCLHWFDPLAWLAFWLAGRDMEVAADEAVLGRVGPQRGAAYCQTLLQLAAGQSPARVCPIGFGYSDVKNRVRRVLAWRPTGRAAALVSVVLCAALCVACAANPAPAEAPAESAAPEQSYFAQTNSEPENAAAPAAQPEAKSTTQTETQAAGDAEPVGETTLTLQWPVPDYTHVSRWMSSSHKGADLVGDEGCDIVAMAGGTVTQAGWYDSYGYAVTIDHGQGFTSLYAHMLDVSVAEGDEVTAGQLIGHMGNSGNSTGLHCHVEATLNGEPYDIHEAFPDY